MEPIRASTREGAVSALRLAMRDLRRRLRRAERGEVEARVARRVVEMDWRVERRGEE